MDLVSCVHLTTVYVLSIIHQQKDSYCQFSTSSLNQQDLIFHAEQVSHGIFYKVTSGRLRRLHASEVKRMFY